MRGTGAVAQGELMRFFAEAARGAGHCGDTAVPVEAGRLVTTSCCEMNGFQFSPASSLLKVPRWQRKFPYAMTASATAASANAAASRIFTAVQAEGASGRSW